MRRVSALLGKALEYVRFVPVAYPYLPLPTAAPEATLDLLHPTGRRFVGVEPLGEQEAAITAWWQVHAPESILVTDAFELQAIPALRSFDASRGEDFRGRRTTNSLQWLARF